MQTVECIASIKKFASIERDEVLVDISPIKSGAAEDDGDRDPALVHEFEVVTHHQRRFHEQTAHADGVGLSFIPGTQDVVDRLFYAEIHHLIAVIGEDDVDKVLANIVDVALYGSEHEDTFIA